MSVLYTLAIVSTLLASPEAMGDAPMECALTLEKTSIKPYEPLFGVFTLTNTSTKRLTIVYGRSPLEHLDLVITDKAGKTVSEGRYGDLFAPFAEPQTLLLEPGRTFSPSLAPLAVVRRENRKVGEYRV